MAYSFTQTLPFTTDIYRRFVAAMQDDSPEGLVVWVGEKVNDGIQVLQVWESEEHYETFARDRVGAITQDGVFEAVEYDPPNTEPPREKVEVLNVWTGIRSVNPWPGSGSLVE